MAAKFTAVDASRSKGTIFVATSSAIRASNAAKHCPVLGDELGALLGVAKSLPNTVGVDINHLHKETYILSMDTVEKKKKHHQNYHCSPRSK